MLFKTFLLLSTFLLLCDAQNESKIVTIDQGPVRGYKTRGSQVFEFFGIPYATAPTGTQKFKAPLPAPTWTETLDAVESNITCIMNPTLSDNLNMKEDCLVVNVHAPSTEAANLPVVVNIHGGAYTFGYGNQGSPRALVESQKVVAVNFNYRLGVHGFLCLGTEDIPGNAGLRDMIAALHWVKNNIARFGGDPDEVTLAGCSSGASAVDLLSLSKAAEGLFNKLIVDCGAHVAAWSVQMEPIKNAQNYAKKLNFNNVGNLTALEEFYKTISYELLVSDISRLNNYNTDLVFAPCIENDLGQERILDDSPINIIKLNEYAKLPLLSGFANMEGIFKLDVFDQWAPKMNEKFSEFLVVNLDFQDDDEKETVAQNIKEFYFGNKSVGLYTLFDYIDYFTDVMFAYPVLRSVKLQTEAGHDQIYLYEYAFYNNYVSVPGVPDILTNFPGAFHCAQIKAVFDWNSGAYPERYTDEFRRKKAQLRELWINFITTGKPVPVGSPFPSWPPTNASRSPHMIFGDTIELGGAANEARAQFWDDIYDRHYLHPKPPVFVESDKRQENAGIVSKTIIFYVVFICMICLI